MESNLSSSLNNSKEGKKSAKKLSFAIKRMQSISNKTIPQNQISKNSPSCSSDDSDSSLLDMVL